MNEDYEVLQRAVIIFAEAMQEKTPEDFQLFTGLPLSECKELFSIAQATLVASEADFSDFIHI